MNTKLAIVSALLFAVALPAAALEIDITNDPNKDFLRGYYNFYGRADNGTVCEATQMTYPSGKLTLFLPDECEGASKDRLYQDAMKEIAHVKATTKFRSYGEYLRSAETESQKPRAPKASGNRCLDSTAGTYLFLPAEAQNKPGWNYLYMIYNGGRLHTSQVGFWKQDGNGSIIADLGLELVNVNMVS